MFCFECDEKAQILTSANDSAAVLTRRLDNPGLGDDAVVEFG